jgi:hypothetical protein
MNTTTKGLYGTPTALTIAVGVLFSSCSRSPQTLVTGINLRDIDGTPAVFHGYYVADGITNKVQGSMKTNFSGVPNFTFAARSLIFEFAREQRSPHGFELTVSTSGRNDRTAHSQYGIRGHWILNKDGSEEWMSEPFTDQAK